MQAKGNRSANQVLSFNVIPAAPKLQVSFPYVPVDHKTTHVWQSGKMNDHNRLCTLVEATFRSIFVCKKPRQKSSLATSGDHYSF